jgi:oxaloacetate decarboxylase alpha subunit
MLSNFQAQLAAAGLSHKFEELLEECAAVRRELAWPIMITPFSQFVGTQAVMNMVHGERYAIVPDEVKKYALGYYGKLLGPVDPNTLDRIIQNGSPKIPLHLLLLNLWSPKRDQSTPVSLMTNCCYE